jgi:hypothetical protein
MSRRLIAASAGGYADGTPKLQCEITILCRCVRAVIAADPQFQWICIHGAFRMSVSNHSRVSAEGGTT